MYYFKVVERGEGLTSIFVVEDKHYGSFECVPYAVVKYSFEDGVSQSVQAHCLVINKIHAEDVARALNQLHGYTVPKIYRVYTGLSKEFTLSVKIENFDAVCDYLKKHGQPYSLIEEVKE